MMKVLFSGGGGAGNEALWRLLGHRYTLHFGDADPFAIDPAIPEGRRHQLPWASDPNFLDKMVDLCHRLRIDLLVPGVDDELLALAQGVDALSSTRLLLPHADYVKTMLDKLSMIQVLSDMDIPVPFSRTLADDIKDFRFPCISKPRSGRGSRDVRVLNSVADAMSLNFSLGDAAKQILLQEKVEGVEYTVQMVANAKGQLFAIVPVKVGVKRGVTIHAETEAEPRVIAACRAIHEACPTCGCYNIQLMLTAEGKAFPFEINPRISTTFCLSVAAGIDPIAVFLDDIHTDDIISFTAGLQLRRHWVNHFS